MTYENKDCPCGLKKMPDTMLCDLCMDAFSNTVQMKTFLSTEPKEARRAAAIRLIAASRRRRNQRL